MGCGCGGGGQQKDTKQGGGKPGAYVLTTPNGRTVYRTRLEAEAGRVRAGGKGSITRI